MKRVFADTDFFIGLLNRRDQLHERAVAIYSREDYDEIITTTWILAELADGMSQPVARLQCREFIRDLHHRKDTRIVDQGQSLSWRGFELFGKREDKEWSLTDCISFTVMADEGLTDALTGDHHLVQAGFTALLRK